MQSLRHHLRQNRWLAAWLVGVALLMRVVVPAGYMPVASGHAVTIELCSGAGPMTMAATPDHPAKPGDHGKAEMLCGFSGLSTPSLAGADPVVLALAIAYIVATVFRAVAPARVTAPAYLRPPLRGPPLPA